MSTFYRTVFSPSKCVRCTPLINMFGSKSRTLRQQNSRSFFSTTGLAHFEHLCNDILFMHKTYKPNMLSVLFQLKVLIGDKGWCV